MSSISVIYRDDDFLIVNKPFDLRIQHYPKNPNDPSVESLLKCQFPEITKFRNVHQLDYATSGVYVLALNKKAAAEASQLFRERTVKKTYLAIVHGHMANDTYFVNQPIGNDPDHEFRMALISLGKPAQTEIKVLDRGYYEYKEEKTGNMKKIPVTKVSLSPISGRRHQLRLHLKYLGHPIIGDFNYETVYTDTFRMMLHAHQIILPLPHREPLVCIADDPFIDLMNKK